MACAVIPGFFGVMMQVLLFLCSILTLVFKKSRDRTRSWFEFGLDSSKQLMGAGMIHCLNLLFAEHLTSYLNTGDECEWYWVNIMVDTTIGVGISALLLRGSMVVLEATLGIEESLEFESGAYKESFTNSINYRKYAKQLANWLLIVVAMKLCMLVLMVIFALPLQAVAHLVLTPVSSNSAVKLLVVMIVTPVIMNAFQFWVTDNIIKKKGPTEALDDEHTFDRVPLQHADQDDSSVSNKSRGESDLNEYRSVSDGKTHNGEGSTNGGGDAIVDDEFVEPMAALRLGPLVCFCIDKPINANTKDIWRPR
eukprot:TRINITY_DN4669_c0_g1_i1.p1 TRINITY_DN4669_c0_g1~~TRINITY_DN4669_c0_g1_i1.p1  ORF type:complete len:331 (+),score=65.83 TRINITY_DN4669_c0_g1_i1:69-995(+)